MKRGVLRTAVPAILVAALSLTLLVRERWAAVRMATLTGRLAESWPLYVEDQLWIGEIKRLHAEWERLGDNFDTQFRLSMAMEDAECAYKELVRLEIARLARTGECVSEEVAKQLRGGACWGGPMLAEELAFGNMRLRHVVVAYYWTRLGRAAWRGFVRPCDDAASASSLMKEYLEGQRAAGAPASRLDVEGADEAWVAGQGDSVDVVFRKGNTVAGATSASDVHAAEAFARRMARNLPETMPTGPTETDAESMHRGMGEKKKKVVRARMARGGTEGEEGGHVLMAR